IEIINNKIYSANGRVVDVSLGTHYGTYLGLGSENAVAIDTPNNRAIFVTNVNGAYSVRVYELGTFRFIGSVPLPSLGLVPRKLVRWGTNGLALRTDFSRVFIIQTNLIDGGGPVPTPSPTPQITPTPTPTPATTFIRQLNIPANDLMVNSFNEIVATVPGSAGAPLGNTMTHIDPATAQVLASTFIGSEPNKIAASDDGQTLWTTLTGATAIRNYNYQTRTAGTQFVPPAGFQTPLDMAVMPASPGTIVISGSSTNGILVFDNGVQRAPATTGGVYGITTLAFSNSGNILYGFNGHHTGFDLVKFTITDTTVTGSRIAENLVSGFGTAMKFYNGLIYTTNGRVIDPETLNLVGTFQGGGSSMAIDPASNRIFFINENAISAFDLQTYVPLGTTPVTGFSGTPTSLARWGANGLVFRAPSSFGSSDSSIYLVQSALVSTDAPIPSGLKMNAQFVTVSESSFNPVVTVTRTGEPSTTVSVDYATADGTAVAGSDYSPRSGTLVFAPGETSKTISLQMINDNIFEGPENFTVNLSNPTGPNAFIVSPSTTTINVNDNDPRPSITSAGTTVLEPAIGTTSTANVQVQLSNPSVETVTVNYSTTSSTATPGSDYVTTNGVVTFAPMETVKSVPVQILADLASEPDEVFSVNFTNPTNGTVTQGAANVTIRNLNHAAHAFDFDGDGKTDVGIYRPSNGQWWINRSSTGMTTAGTFGASTDVITPADFTGDGKTDIAFFRPSTGLWFVLRSEDFSYFSLPFGTAGDLPVPGDFDGDGKADLTVFRASTSTWYIRRSSDGGATIQGFGSTGDIPVPADYDGDGKTDVAIYRPSTGQWWVQRSTAGVAVLTFGVSTDKPVQGDYTGDGKADMAYFRPSTGLWYILRSEDFSFYSTPFGTNGDIPAPGDYDGDGRFDPTVFRPSTTTWYSQRSTAGTMIQQFGSDGDRPIPNAFVP
ncbi:MAG TPA: Calx-beta domain-containing protein, partial [Pyrinomonadaceae bacterium]|nr:Calx-beta domain-containing protein [Pyrinomonadaceae bacterium]